MVGLWAAFKVCYSAGLERQLVRTFDEICIPDLGLKLLGLFCETVTESLKKELKWNSELGLERR